jgi:hypothetical protein
MPKKRADLDLLPVLVAGRDFRLDLPSGRGIPTQPKKGPYTQYGYLSYSQIETYLKCAHRYFLERVLKVLVPYSVFFAQGSAWAKTLEKTNKHFLRRGEHLGRDALCEWWKTLWSKEAKKVKNWFGENEGLVNERGLKFVRLLYQDHDEPPDFRPVRVNRKAGVELTCWNQYAGVWVKSVIDLVEEKKGERMVWDFKLASEARWYNPLNSLQLDFYRVAVQAPYCGYHIAQKKYGTLATKTNISLGTLEPMGQNLEQTDARLTRIVSHVARGISAGSFPPCNPSENNFCSAKWCHHWAGCRGKGFAE